jgi:hypothetical protein
LLQTPEEHVSAGPLSTFGQLVLVLGSGFFFNVVKFLHLAKKRKGGGKGGGYDFYKGFFLEIKWPKVAMFHGEKKES